MKEIIKKVFDGVVEFVGKLKAKLVETFTRTMFTYRASTEAGFRPCFLVGNRPIDRKHMDKLYSSLKRREKDRFTVPGTTTPLLPLLEVMQDYPEKERLHFIDLCGNELTLDSPGVREGLYYLVLDGQHRVAACYTYGVDMLFILVVVDVDEIFEFVGDYNKDGKGWNGVDWITSYRATGKFNSPLFTKMDELSAILPGVSERYKSYLLTCNPNGMKKADVEMGRETLVYDEALVARGTAFAIAIAVGLPIEGKISKEQMVVGKWFRRLEGVRTILSVIPQCSGALLATYDVDMKCFLGNIDGLSVSVMADLIKKRSYGEVEAYYLKRYKEYVDLHSEDRESVSADIETKYAALAEQRQRAEAEVRSNAVASDPDRRPARLLSGSVDDMRRNAEAIDRFNSKKQQEKEARSARKAERSEGVHS